MSFVTGCLTYIGERTKIEYWNMKDFQENIVHIGAYCSIAARVTFMINGNHKFDHASSFPFYELGICTSDDRNINAWGKGAPSVGNDVWIGYGSTILSGVHVSDGMVVGARSVVTKTFPPYSIVAGNPAKIIRMRFEEPVVQRFLICKWWDLPEKDVVEYLAPLQFDVNLFLDKAEEIIGIYDILNNNIENICAQRETKKKNSV